MMIACYLVYSKICQDAESALRLFGEKRTRDAKGVTIPSLIRYVHYFAKFVNGDDFPSQSECIVCSPCGWLVGLLTDFTRDALDSACSTCV